MSHREFDQASDLRRLLASFDADLAEAKQACPVHLELIRALKMERDKVIAALAAQEAQV